VDVEANDALTVAEKLRTEVAHQRFRIIDGKQIQKTISIGVSEYPTDSDNFWQTVKYADVALYQAKANGRNRTVRFREEMNQEA
jgi:two-component system cell cycle response regulator